MNKLQLNWRDTPENEKPENSSWSKDGYVLDHPDVDVKYQLYFDNSVNKIILKDIVGDVTYELKEKSKGYILAFKLHLKD